MVLIGATWNAPASKGRTPITVSTTHTGSAQVWQDLAAGVVTPDAVACIRQAETHASIEHEEGTEGWHLEAIKTFRRLANSGTFDYIGRSMATPLQAAELAKVQAAGEQGLHGHHMDGKTRGVMIRRGWILTTGRDERDWTGKLHLTFEGHCQLIAAPRRPIDLDAGLSLVLERLQRHEPMGGFEGGYDERVLRLYQLIDGDNHLTPAGTDALARWHAAPKLELTPSKAQDRLLVELINQPEATNRRAMGHHASTYDACEKQRWIRWGQRDEQGRAPLFITAAGREAHQRFLDTAQRPDKQRTPRRQVTQLREGDKVRLANRSSWRGLTAAWVIVDHVQAIPRHGREPGGYVVWTRTGDGQVNAYAGRHPFHRNTKFEVAA